MSVYAPAADYIWELVRSYDIDPEPLFRQAGIDPAIRFDTRARISRAAVNELNRVVFEATGDEAMGIRATRFMHPSHFGPLGFAWLSSLSLRSALDKFARYSNLIAHAFNLSYEEVGDEVQVTFFWSGDFDAAREQRFAAMANLTNLVRHLLGPDFDPKRIEFQAQAPADPTLFEAYFRCPLSFGQDRPLLVLDRALMDRALPRGHAEMAQMSDELVIRYLRDLDRDDIMSQVRAALVEQMPEGVVSIETVAARLAMSSRTLRRRLDQLGVTFRQVLSEQRREMALRYIKDDSLTLTEISYLLGFSEPSSFTRAFKGWTGDSPSAARS